MWCGVPQHQYATNTITKTKQQPHDQPTTTTTTTTTTSPDRPQQLNHQPSLNYQLLAANQLPQKVTPPTKYILHFCFQIGLFLSRMSRNQSFSELPIGFRKRSRIPTQKTSRFIEEQNKNTIKDEGSTALRLPTLFRLFSLLTLFTLITHWHICQNVGPTFIAIWLERLKSIYCT